MTDRVVQERIGLAQHQWRKLTYAATVVAQELRSLGHTNEANLVVSYIAVISRHEADHLKRLQDANGHAPTAHDGVLLQSPTWPLSHHKDSPPDAASHSQPEHTQAPRDEAGAGTDGGHGDAIVDPPVDNAPVAAAPVSDPEESGVRDKTALRLHELITDWSPRAREEQAYEVAIKYLYRARSILECGTDHMGRPTKREHKEQLVSKLIRAAYEAVEPMVVGGVK